MTRREAIEMCSEALKAEMAANGFATAGKLARAAHVDVSLLQGYLKAVGLPSAPTWEKLRACMPGLPVLSDQVRLKIAPTMRRTAALIGGNDITPIERNQVTALLFGCRPQEVPDYNELSFRVLNRLSDMTSKERNGNRIDMLVRLFAEARADVRMGAGQ